MPSAGSRWFAKVGAHPAYPAMAGEAARIAGEKPAEAARFLAEQKAWDPDAFTDLIERVHRGEAALADICQRMQEREWQVLFDYTFDAAVDAR